MDAEETGSVCLASVGGSLFPAVDIFQLIADTDNHKHLYERTNRNYRLIFPELSF